MRKALLYLFVFAILILPVLGAYTQDYGKMDLQEIGLDNTTNFAGEFMAYWFLWGPILFIVLLKIFWLNLVHKFKNKF